MKYFICFGFFTLVFSQEFEVDGDLRVGAIDGSNKDTISDLFLNELWIEWFSTHKTNASGFSFAICLGKSPLPAIIAIFISVYPF